jgi:insertion element IS1 protein InsB
VAWVLGGRDTETFRRLYAKVQHLSSCLFYPDDWDAFAKVLPPERHVVGKAHTLTIERDNSNLRHHLARFTRRTKVVSHAEDMIHTTLKLWCAITTPETFTAYQALALSIFM